MNRRILLGMVLPAVTLASVAALFTGKRQAVSLQIWLAFFVVGFAAAALLRLRDTAPVAPTSRRAILGIRRATTSVSRSGNGRLRNIEGRVLRARDSQRSFSLHLQPQLVELATHFLRVNHGVEIELDSAAASEVLGDVDWLIEAPRGPRTPTIEELDRFLDILVATPGPGTA